MELFLTSIRNYVKMPQYIIIAFSILLLNIVISRPINYPSTIAPVFILWFLITFFHPLSPERKRVLPLTFVLLSLPLINGFDVLSGHTELSAFIKIYALWCFAVLSILVAATAKIKVANFAVERAASFVLVVLMLIVTMQITFAYAFKDTTLFTMLDKVSFGGPVDLTRFAVPGMIRPIGLYFEPSVAALVMLTLMTVLLLRDRMFTAAGFIGAIGIVITTSYSGYIGLVVLLLGFATGKISGAMKPSSYSPYRPLVWVAALAGFSVFYVHCQSDAVSPLTRSQEASQTIASGHMTSTYERLLQPVSILKDVILVHPSGITFGKFPRPEFQTFYYHFANGQIGSCTLNNGFYILVFYFGWLGIIGVLLVLLSLIFRAVQLKEFNLLVLFLYICLSFGVTGMILRPEYLVMLLLVIYQCRISSGLHRDREKLAGVGAEKA